MSAKVLGVTVVMPTNNARPSYSGKPIANMRKAIGKHSVCCMGTHFARVTVSWKSHGFLDFFKNHVKSNGNASISHGFRLGEVTVPGGATQYFEDSLAKTL